MTGMRGRLARSLLWLRIRDRAGDVWDRLLYAVLTRCATAEMRHAALLLGWDCAWGYGRAGLLSHLDEWEAGNDLGMLCRWHEGEDATRAAGAFCLERSLYVDAERTVP